MGAVRFRTGNRVEAAKRVDRPRCSVQQRCGQVRRAADKDTPTGTWKWTGEIVKKKIDQTRKLELKVGNDPGQGEAEEVGELGSEARGIGGEEGLTWHVTMAPNR